MGKQPTKPINGPKLVGCVKSTVRFVEVKETVPRVHADVCALWGNKVCYEFTPFVCFIH